MNKIYNTLTRCSSAWMFDVTLGRNIIMIKFDGNYISVIEQDNKNIRIFGSISAKFKTINSRMGPNALREIIMELAPKWFLHARKEPNHVIGRWQKTVTKYNKDLALRHPVTWKVSRYHPFVSDKHTIKLSSPQIESEADCAAYLAIVDALFAALPLPIADEVYTHVEAKAPYDNYHPHRAPCDEIAARKFFEEFELTQKIAAERCPLVASLFTVILHGGEFIFWAAD